MISRIYSPCTTIDEPQLRILVNLLTKVAYAYSEMTEEDFKYLNEFLVVFKSHLV